jgi:hypothetical protein
MTRIAGKDGVYSIKGYSSYLYSRDAKGWRDMTLLKFEDADVTAAGIVNEHGEFAFTKEADKWVAKHKKPKAGALAPLEKFDSGKVADMLRAFRSLNADNFAESGKTAADLGLDKPVATVSLTFKDGGKKNIEVGATAEGTSRWVRVTGKDELFSISSWAADWALAEPKKFQEGDKAAGAGGGAAPPPDPHAGMMPPPHDDPH